MTNPIELNEAYIEARAYAAEYVDELMANGYGERNAIALSLGRGVEPIELNCIFSGDAKTSAVLWEYVRGYVGAMGALEIIDASYNMGFLKERPYLWAREGLLLTAGYLASELCKH